MGHGLHSYDVNRNFTEGGVDLSTMGIVMAYDGNMGLEIVRQAITKWGLHQQQ